MRRINQLRRENFSVGDHREPSLYKNDVSHAVTRTMSPGGLLPDGAISPGEFWPFHMVFNAFLGNVKVRHQRFPNLGQHPLNFGYTQDDIIDPLYPFLIRAQFLILFHLVSVCIHCNLSPGGY
jgi:hypothetical protein